MRRRSAITFLGIVLLVAGCATAPSGPPAAAPGGAGIGIAVQIRPPLGAGHDATTNSVKPS